MFERIVNENQKNMNTIKAMNTKENYSITVEKL